jgi:hypothetical protein
VKSLGALVACVLCASLVGSCKKKDAGQLKAEPADVRVEHVPPPVARGKCLVDEYENATILKQSCTLDGYAWLCSTVHDSTTDHDTTHCVRQGQATAEDVPADAPHAEAAGYFGGATYGMNAAGSPVKMPAHWTGDAK